MELANSTAELIQNITDEYRAAGNKWPATTRMVTEWALANNKLKELHDPTVAMYSRMFHAAWRNQYIKDSKGRRVRKFHSARMGPDGDQLCLWADISSASRDFMSVSLGDRRQSIVRDCLQLTNDTEAYNELYNPRTPIQMSLDFTREVFEIRRLQAMDPNLDEADDPVRKQALSA